MGRLREPSVRWAQLLAASGFALAQPLFDILGKNAEFFAVRGSKPSDVVLFALVVTFVPSGILFGIELLAGLVSARAALVCHHAFLAGLAAIFAVQALKRLGVDGTTALIVGAALIGIGISIAVLRTNLASTFMTVLAAAPVVFLCVFLFGSSTTKVVFPGDVEVQVANVRSTTPVVFLLFDELPVISLLDEKGEIDEKRFPNFARLARSSTWFENTTTYSASTTVAVPSLLTGKAPGRKKVPVFQSYPHNLFTLLGRTYRLSVTESQTRLCPPQLCARETQPRAARLSGLYSDARIVYLHLLSPPGLEDRLPAIDESWGDFGNETEAPVDSLSGVTVSKPKVSPKTFYVGRVRDFNAFVASLRAPKPGDPPSLDFLHVLLPHGPWLYFPDGRGSAVAAANAPGRTGELWWDDALANQAHQRHLLQLAYTDKLLGNLLDRLEETGLWDEAVVVVTADHGISFHGGDNRRAPTPTNLAELAFIPLFVKLPGEEKGRVVERHVTIDDILPTIADALGVTVPWRISGSSALTGGEGPDTVRVGNVSKPYEEALAQRAANLVTQIELFGNGGWGPEFYGLGPYESLLGRKVSDLATSLGKDGTATVDKIGSRFLRSLPEESRLVPSPLELTLSDVAKGTELALAVNGTIATVAQAYQGATGPVRVSFLVPEDAYEAGANEVQVYLIDGSGATPLLTTLETSLTES
jgi:hypothetical protein